MVQNGASSHKTNYIEIFSEILNLEGHQNLCIGSKVTAILMNGWILLLVELHWEGSASAACAAGFIFYFLIFFGFKIFYLDFAYFFLFFKSY